MEVGNLVEHHLVAAEGGLGVPDDVFQDLVDGVTAHRELGAPRVVCGWVEVLDGEMEVAAFRGGHFGVKSGLKR